MSDSAVNAIIGNDYRNSLIYFVDIRKVLIEINLLIGEEGQEFGEPMDCEAYLPTYLPMEKKGQVVDLNPAIRKYTKHTSCAL